MDNIQLRTGELFKGIRDLPVGAHYIYHSTGQGVSGFFLYIEKQDVQVRKWNTEYECYERLRREDEELFVSNVEELYPVMVQYPTEKLKLWQEMTYFIDKNVILHLEPSSHAIYRSEAEYDSIETEFETFSALNAPSYSTIPKRMRGYGMSPEEITTRNMDKSYILYDLIHSLSEEDRLLGEMQYSFISFILGQSLESFEHWKEIFILVCNCEKALQDRSNFYTKLIRNL